MPRRMFQWVVCVLTHHRQVNLSDPRLTQEDDGLLITDIQAGDEGLYECYVYNQVNHDSLEINVVFRGKGSVNVPVMELYYTIRNGSLL